MKKIVIGIVLLSLLISLCGCDASKKLTVTYEDGSTSAMSINKLISLKTADERTFDTIERISGKAKIVDVSTYQGRTYNGYDRHSVILELDNNCKLTVIIDINEIKRIEGKTRPTEKNGDGTDYLSSETWEYIHKYRDSFYNGDTIVFENAWFAVADNSLSISCSQDSVRNMQ